MHDDPRFDLLVAEADRVGWPRWYKKDLLVHDRDALDSIPPGDPFVWMVRESGTHIFPLPATETWLQAHTKQLGEQGLWFGYLPPLTSGWVLAYEQAGRLTRLGCAHDALVWARHQVEGRHRLHVVATRGV